MVESHPRQRRDAGLGAAMARKKSVPGAPAPASAAPPPVAAVAAGAGTITDVQYTGEYFWHQSPSMMNYIAALNGVAPRALDRAFTYCELGCGKGVTSTVLAALHPHGQFYACDLNPEHIRGAVARAVAAGVANVKFLERDIAAMGAEKLPKFDFITLHGLWSWVSGAVRAEIGAFIKAKLKPGGLVMLSYNAMPGWAPLKPIHRMMHAYADALPGNSIDKARQAYAYVKFLVDNKADYFTANPAAAQQVESIGTVDPRYAAHEYMAPHSDPFYFAEVEQHMREEGLGFVGSLLPGQNYPEVSVAARFRELMATAPSRVILETHRDFVANTRFRVDLYALPEAGRAATDALLAENLYFALLAEPSGLPLKGENAGIQYNFGPYEKSVRVVHALVGGGVADWAALERATGMTPEAASRFLQEMVLARHLWPCAPVQKPADTAKLQVLLDAEARKDGLNRRLLLRPAAGSAEYVAR